MSDTQQNTIVLLPAKSMAAGILLALFFGPLGLFYSSVPGGLIMLIVGGLLAVIGGIITGGIGFIPILVLIGIICVIWAAIAVNRHNKKVMTKAKI